MTEMKEIPLPSGAVLKISTIPFEAANNLKKVVMRDMKHLSLDSSKQVLDLCKDYLCLAFGSDEVEKCLWECMKKCIYNSGSGDFKIDSQTFESVKAREDFTEVQFQVGSEALLPFSKGLFAVLQNLLGRVTANIPQ